ncbi:MAG: RNA polymerase sigma factor FliA [Pseudomonadota bacterium]
MSIPLFSAPHRSDIEALVAQHAPMVRRLAYHMMAKLPASIAVDDLIQAGMLGLLDAVQHFQSGQGAQFETYAVLRVRGAMLDELRQHDWLPRRTRHKARQVQQAMLQLEQRLGRAPSSEEIAGALGMSLSDYHDVLMEARGAQVLHLEDLSDSEDEDFLGRHLTDDSPNPHETLEAVKFQADLKAAIENLPTREQLVISLYYQEELNLREIGEVLEVSESRASQLLSQATLRLRARMQGWLEGSVAPRGRRGPRKKALPT